MRTKALLIASAAVLLALPALAQQTAPTQPAPATAPAAQSNTVAPANTSTPGPSNNGADESAVEEVSSLNLQPPAPPVEYPGWARRDPWMVGPLSPHSAGLGDDAWGSASGQFLIGTNCVLNLRQPFIHTP